MKKNKILSLLMATTMLFSTCAYVFAADSNKYTQEQAEAGDANTQVEYSGKGGNGLGEDDYPEPFGPEDFEFDDNGEGYLITVPSLFKLSKDEATTGNVSIVGLWSTVCNLNVEVPQTISMKVKDLPNTDNLDLAITFTADEGSDNNITTDGSNYKWIIDGNNEEFVQVKNGISAANMDVLFGTWEGTIIYEVELTHAQGAHTSN